MKSTPFRWLLLALLSPGGLAACGNDARAPLALDGDVLVIGGDAEGSADGGNIPDPDATVIDGGDGGAQDADGDGQGGGDAGDGGSTDVDPDADTDADSDVISTTCGDGIVDEGESCDQGDANADAPDACRTTCQSPTCGDGIVDTGEACDDGNAIANDFCSDTCEQTTGTLCGVCSSDEECGRVVDRCVSDETGSYCVTGCADDAPCPDGFSCVAEGEGSSFCVPDAGLCLPCLDADGDGFGVGPECAALDCNDEDAAVGAPSAEVCDGVDNDCDGTIDESPATGDVVWWRDADGDGFGTSTLTIRACSAPDGYVAAGDSDCNDTDANVNPDGLEVCDGVDNDCAPRTSDGASDPGARVPCDGRDADECAAGTILCVDGALICEGDTADATLELCDGRDNDCNPETPDGADEAVLGTPCDSLDADRCAGGRTICRAGTITCTNDVNRVEVCDGLDNDCDGSIDEQPTSDAASWFVDADGDGFGTGEAVVGCRPAVGNWVIEGGDCNDATPLIRPGLADTCDGVDTDCDGTIDEDAPEAVTVYDDADGDGFGDDDSAFTTCAPDPGAVTEGGDCDDADADVSPAAREICDDGVDNNCDFAGDCDDTTCASAFLCVEPDCTSRSIGSRSGLNAAVGSNRTTTNSTTGSCGGLGRDETVTWTAPAAGRYVFDTLGTVYNTVLYARDINCAGPQLACNDNIGTGTGAARNASRITLELERGQTIALVVDAAGAEAVGDWVLNIGSGELCDDRIDNDGDSAVDCADPDCAANVACTSLGCPNDAIGSAVGLGVYGGTTVGGDFNNEGSCGGRDSEDVTLSYTAATNASYTFSTNGSAFPTRLYLLDECGGDELACNFVNGTANAAVTRPLTAGQTVILVVDGQNGRSGEFLVSVARGEAGFCSDTIDNDTGGGTDCADLDCELDSACCATDVFEPNQGTTAAPSTTLTTYEANRDALLTVNSNDPDLFNVPVCAGAQVRVTADFVHAGGNIDLALLANLGGFTTQVGSATSTTDDETLLFTVPRPVFPGAPTLDRVFLRVTMNEANRCNDYRLSITVDRSDCD